MSSSLRLFPSSSTTAPQPRKSSLKKPRHSEESVAASSELRGVAFQVNSSTAIVEPAEEQIKHSLFCDPASPPRSTGRSPRHQFRTARSPSGTSSIPSAGDPEHGETLQLPGEDDLSPLPENTQFGTLKPSRGSIKRPKLPQNISTEVQPDTDTLASPGGDGLSPLPSQQLFAPTSPRSPECPPTQILPPQGLRAGSPGPQRSNSTRSSAPPYSPGDYGATKSIFPQYDPSRPLQQQKYYPDARSPTPTLPHEKVSKLGIAAGKRPEVERFDSAVALDGYKHIPAADGNDLLEIFNASCCHFPVAGREVQLNLLQPYGNDTMIAVGISQDQLLYSMEKDLLPPAPKQSNVLRDLVIKKHGPRNQTPFQVAQLALPDCEKSIKERESISIFPQMAAIQALEALSNSPAAAEIATFDPTAKSPEVAKLAQDTVAEAHRYHRCELVRSTRKRDSLGAVEATYHLEHPSLGAFPITITKSIAGGRHPRDPRAKICLHHPSATPAAVASETLVLAFLDFARDACVLDTPGLLALEGPYIIDTIMCALLAIAVIENDALMAETITFDAPPKSPLPLPKRNSRITKRNNSVAVSSKRSSGWFRSNKKGVKEIVEPEPPELPVLTQGALAILGLSFKTAVFVLEVGVKITAGAVVGISHMVRKA